MYGLVNKAVQGLVVSQFGEETWEKIKQEAGLEVEEFLAMEAYDDSVTYGLVGAASKVLDTPAEDILHAFGEYWVLEIATKSYGDLMSAAGPGFAPFLQNLDHLHSRVQMSFPKLKPPSFRCTEMTAGSMRLHYYSSRAGLAPFVVGLLHGLAKHFSVTLEVEHVSAEGADHEEFLLKYAQAQETGAATA